MCDLDEIPRRVTENIGDILKRCVSEDFHRKMNTRMVIGAFRYDQKHKGKVQHFVRVIRRKVDRYEKTGDTEALVDAANYLMLEYEYGPHAHKEFKSTDDEDHWRPI